MLQGEYSAILSTSVKLPFVIESFIISILSGRLSYVLLYLQDDKLDPKEGGLDVVWWLH